jgi:hypothetical protein
VKLGSGVARVFERVGFGNEIAFRLRKEVSRGANKMRF